MTGFELILSAALCLTCVDKQNDTSNTNLIQFNGNWTNAELYFGSQGQEETNTELRDTNAELRKIRAGLIGKRLRIVTLEDRPLSYTEKLANGTIVGRGVAFELIDFLCEKFNFSYEIVLPTENKIGSVEDFKNSLIGILNESRADMAAAFLPQLSEVRKFVYYSSTILDEGEWVMVMQRPSESASGSGLMAPFEFWVWILIFVSLLAVGPIIYYLIILRNKLTGDTEQKPYSLGHCAWFVYGALMKQGSVLSPIADSTRLLFATWWIFITILTSFYTANLTAFLTLSKFTLPYNTVEDILLKNKEFVSVRGSGIEYAIRGDNETLSMLKTMYKNKHAVFTQNVNDSENLINYVEREGFVFVRDRPAVNHMLYADYRYRKTVNMINEKVHCPFATAKEPFMKKKRGFAYPRGSNISRVFDSELLNLVEQGIVKYLSHKNLPNAHICPQDLGGTERQLRNSDLLMTYYIMFAGFATSMVVFSSELMFRYLNSRFRVDSAGKWARHGAGVGRTTNGLSVTPSRWWPFNQNNSSDLQALTNNVTPPPPYQSIFSVVERQQQLQERLQNSHRGDSHRWQRFNDDNTEIVNGASIFGRGRRLVEPEESTGVRRYINGRDYMVIRNSNGLNQLIPMRAPSAALFQYSYTE